ncbi:hypothetical protein LCGC14_1975440, partial [marine sediment metagenome]
MAVLVVCTAWTGAARSAPALTAQQQTELATLKGQLADPDRTAKTKREAALLLLTRPYPQAGELLAAFLANPANRAAQIAITEAVSESGIVKVEFVDPLMAMLTGTEPSLRVPAAKALAAARNFGVLDRFAKLLGDAKTDRAICLAVVGALGRILDKQAVDLLIGLLGNRDEPIRNAACDSLAKLTSIRAFGRDSRQWRKWWRENKDKKQSDWLA